MTKLPGLSSPPPSADLALRVGRLLSGAGKELAESGNPASPVEWARKNASIVHPALGRIPFLPYPYQRDFMGSYHEPRRLVVKARQIGFSQTFALEALYRILTQAEQTILLVSRSQDLAVNLLRYCYLTYNNLKEAPALQKANEGEMGFSNGSRIKSIPANRSTGRGFAATAVYLDEFAYAEYADDIYQSVSPAVAQGGFLTIGSTPNGIGNLFHSLYLSGEGFKRFTVPWWQCPAYWTPQERANKVPKESSAWYLRERPKYTMRQWAAEYECDFSGSGAIIFSPDILDLAEVGAIGDKPVRQGRTYLTSVDIGRRNDATVINTFDVTDEPFQRVAHERLERVPYPIIQQAIERRFNQYGGELYIESNGPGDPVIENLTVPAQPFITSAKTKVQAIQALQLLLENGQLKAQWTPQEKNELLLYQWDDKDLVQDCVMSLAIGASVMKDQGIQLFMGPLNPTKEK